MSEIISRKSTTPKTVLSRMEMGAFGERLIEGYLVKNGATILDKNWRIKEGEIDLVVQLPIGTIAFVEVKTRSSAHFGHPLEAIGREKAARLQRLALAWLATHHRLGAGFQIDCAAVIYDAAGAHSLDYRSNVL